MRSTFMGLETARRSLFAHQTALHTTAHNVANADTKGYSRQVVNLVSSIPMEAPGLQRSNTPGQLGTGVEFDYIKRIRESFLDDQFYNESKSLGEWTARADTLTKLEAITNEPSDTGIRQVIEGFWNAWQELSKTPENMTARVLVKERALALVDALNHSAKQLNDLKSDLSFSIGIKATRADTLLDQVSRLNAQIYKVEGFGNNANDLRDQRDLLMDELSQLMNVTVEDTPSGYVVRMGGTELVNGNAKNVQITSAFIEGNYGGELQSGEIFGLIYSRDNYVEGHLQQLNTLARSLVEGEMEVTLPKGSVIPAGTVIGTTTYTGSIEDRTLDQPLTITVQGINGLHQLGYATDGSQGEPFFTLSSGEEALSLRLNPDIQADPSKIVASNRVVLDLNGNEVTVKGNNEMALLIAGLRSVKVNGNGTLDGMFQSMVGELGVQAQEANRQKLNSGILVDQVDMSRQSVSGVSIDEEMTNMIKFQHAYNAAARAMTTFDEMLDRVINGMGIVGR